jgi:hypothetical protein
MGTLNRSLSAGAAVTMSAAALTLLVGCGGTSPTTKERLAQIETSVGQAQTTLGTSEAGSVELQKAREHLAAAKKAADAGKEGQALRHAAEAQVSAELAIAKSQSATARKNAEDTLASIETLRKEAARDDQPVAR